MIDVYTNQTADWQHATGTDRYGKATYADDQTIRCRWEWKRRLIRDGSGAEVISQARVLTRALVEVGDRLIDPTDLVSWPVLSVGKQYGLGGNEIYREVYV